MADETPAPAPTPTPDPSGVTRTPDGTIAAPSPASMTPTPEGTTLLTEAPKADPAKPAEAKPVEGAPEKYEDYKVPDGYEIAGELKTEIDGLFKGIGLSQENAQSLVDFYVKQTQEAFQAPFDAYQEMRKEWRTEADNHPDLRGKLAEGGEVRTTIGKLLSTMPDQQLASDFRKAMDLTGVGDHPAFIRAIYGWAKALTEGSHVAGNGPAPGGQSAPGARPPSAAQAMYPNLPSSGR